MLADEDDPRTAADLAEAPLRFLDGFGRHGRPGRTPKTEGRSPKEFRNPNSEAGKRESWDVALPAAEAAVPRSAEPTRPQRAEVAGDFGFRISAFFRSSVLGLRLLHPDCAGNVKLSSPTAALIRR
jgi:hypothetical protein